MARICDATAVHAVSCSTLNAQPTPRASAFPFAYRFYYYFTYHIKESPR